MKIDKFVLRNEEKIERAINGSPAPNGNIGGIVDKATGKYDNDALLVEYDRLGGYITNLEGDKVVNGSFYDHKNRKAFETPQVSYEFRVNGDRINVKDGEKAPKILEAVKIVEAQKKEVVEKKKAKK